MVHILVVDDHVILGGHVVGNVVVHDQPEQPVEQGQVNLFVELLEVALHHHVAFPVRCLPNVLLRKMSERIGI